MAGGEDHRADRAVSKPWSCRDFPAGERTAAGGYGETHLRDAFDLGGVFDLHGPRELPPRVPLAELAAASLAAGELCH